MELLFLILIWIIAGLSEAIEYEFIKIKNKYDIIRFILIIIFGVIIELYDIWIMLMDQITIWEGYNDKKDSND